MGYCTGTFLCHLSLVVNKLFSVFAEVCCDIHVWDPRCEGEPKMRLHLTKLLPWIHHISLPSYSFSKQCCKSSNLCWCVSSIYLTSALGVLCALFLATSSIFDTLLSLLCVPESPFLPSYPFIPLRPVLTFDAHSLRLFASFSCIPPTSHLIFSQILSPFLVRYSSSFTIRSKMSP